MAKENACSVEASLPDAFRTGFMQSGDGFRLRYALCEPEGCPVKGTVLAIQGRSEFIEKYTETISELNAAGFAVAMLDLRGQGASDRVSSDPYAGHVERFSDFTGDVDRFFNTIVKPQMRGPYFLMGHSLGGLIALSLASSGVRYFDGLLLLAPFVGLHRRVLPEPLIRLLASVLSRLGLSRRAALPYRQPPDFTDQFLTSDRIRYERNLALARQDPPYMLGTPTFGWLRGCLNEIMRLRQDRSLQSIGMPVLLVAPGLDVLVPFKAQIETGRRLNARIVALPESGHDLLQERDDIRTPAISAIISFLNEHAVSRSETQAPLHEEMALPLQ